MYTIYKQGFLFTGLIDNWEGKHLVLNENPSCRTFHQLYHDTHLNLFDLCLDWNGVQSWMGLEWNGIQSWVVGVDSTQMHQHLFDEHEASPIHFEFEHFVLGALQNSICISSSPL